MLELRKKGNKHWLLIDEEIGEFTPSKFTINRLNNVINIVYFNNLKSKEYNVSDCYIFDIDDPSGFNTSDGIAFMDKLEELNCPCFQKDVNNFYISGGTWGSITGDIEEQADLQNALNSKLDKVTTAGVERVYTINADGSQGTKATSDFGTVKGTGTTNRISKFTASGTIGDSQIFDNGTNVGIGTDTPGSNNRLEVNGRTFISAGVEGATNAVLVLRNTIPYQSPFTQNIQLWQNSAGNTVCSLRADGSITIPSAAVTAQGFISTIINNLSVVSFRSSLSNNTGMYFPSTNNVGLVTNGVERIRILPTGEIAIGATTAGARLDVRAQGALATDIAFRVRNSTDTANLLQVTGQGTLSLGLQSSAPTGIEGAIYYNSTDKKHYGFNGTTWEALRLKDVIEGYFDGTNFYTDAGFTNLITPESSKIYVALDTNLQYRWSGSAYVQIGGGGGSGLSNLIHEYVNPNPIPITGTISAIEIYKFKISANTFSSVDRAFFRQIQILKYNSVTAVNDFVSMHISTDGVFSTSLPELARFSITENSRNDLYLGNRFFIIRNGKIEVFRPLGAGVSSDVGQNERWLVNFNPTIDNWIHVSVILGGSNNGVALSSLILTK